ncbi:MAG TPA: histidine phosphatase family protein [Nannocystis sp.]
MPELWLVRHAESLGNVDGSDGDTPLSPRGRLQAAALGRRLAGEVFDRVISSPLQRARETAAIALPDRAVEIEPRVREFVGPRERFVDVSTMDRARLYELLRREADQPRAETGREFMARVRGWLAALPSAGRIVVITHFGVVRECLYALFPAAERVQALGHASISGVRVCAEGSEILAIDDRRHLAELAGA